MRIHRSYEPDIERQIEALRLVLNHGSAHARDLSTTSLESETDDVVLELEQTNLTPPEPFVVAGEEGSEVKGPTLR